MDLTPLYPVAKIIPPEEMQLPNESQRFWHDVTQSILAKDFSKATTLKQRLEEGQREKAAIRNSQGHEWQPRFFTAATTPVGRPLLTPDGQLALDRLHGGDYSLDPNLVLGA